MKIDGKIITNNYKIKSMPIITGKAKYLEEEINDELRKVGAKLIDASKHAINLGNPKTMNIILLGSLVKSMNLEHIDWNKIISNNVKKEFVDINIEAFKVGMNLVKGE
ncbi:pyruvate ferredoxin/flavodoxin oxidoreductase family protein [[Clostridium] sordellii ATCC 9714]|nr:pyruvate ferredoxin/flavodoxin oxidoreductase family protein [[Clostridium] sordellii ATCC 9714] [Paeniclostridium sordellii ATCC 9714]